jgi:hypothetical protein
MKMEQIECSETSAYKIQTPGNHPEENIQHTEHGESLKSKTFLLQHDNARPHTSLKTVEHIVNLGWTVLLHPPYSPDLAPSDFRLFGPMKDGLRGQHFPNYDAAVRTVKQWTTSVGADFYECGMQALVHRWRKCIANDGDYVEK